jgi:hypothetical protein
MGTSTEKIRAEMAAIYSPLVNDLKIVDELTTELITHHYNSRGQHQIITGGETLYIIFQGRPVPYVRTTQAGKWSPAVKRYHNWSKKLANLLIAKAKDWQALYKSKPVGTDLFTVGFVIPENGVYGDRDNYEKAFNDAFQYAGLVKDDKVLGGTYFRRLLPRKNMTSFAAAVKIMECN